ncbi:unnamed protein product [Cylindrotheca closterium]|uniref:Uncharacterized protein n=1 Tax=Cylindrotheca closterium TaxID=2856 RepID=A0AAD2FIT8_9STRA|nr:unnamed protein product [Cylindrotheca closterium]
MNDNFSSVVITKNEDTNNYETRFLDDVVVPERENFRFRKLVSNKRKRRSSTIVDQMGGEFRLQALVMYLSQRVLGDSRLSSVFGSFSLKALALLLGDMMWYALDDSFDACIEEKKHLKSKLLKKLCRLGLMDEAEYFDILAEHFLNSMRMCSFRNTRIITQLGDRFLSLRAALQEVADRIAVKTTKFPATLFAFLRNPISWCTTQSHRSVISDSHQS